MSKFKFLPFLLFCLPILCLAGCGTQAATYTVEFSGSAEEAGVICFLDYSINVYSDLASNPCGDCEDQPVHLYVGDSAVDAANAVAEVIEQADDLWDVTSASGSTVVLTERIAESTEDFGQPATVEGLAMSVSCVSGGSETVLSAEIGSDGGTAVTVSDPQRIAAVYGPSYEMLVALGAEDKIVLRADVHTDNFPWAETVFSRITEIPYLQNVHTAVNFEELMTYEPDLVFTFPRQNELNQLNQAGVAAVAGTSYVHLEDTAALLMAYAEALGGGAVERAQAYADYFEAHLQSVAEHLEGISEAEKPKVYYAGMDVLTTYGKYSDVIEIIEAAGGIAVSADLEAGSRTEIGYEQLMAWDPDYIFLDHGGINDGATVEDMRDSLYTESAYSAITAVKNEKVYTVPSGVFYWDMGLQKILLVEYMAQIFYPDRFADLDMTQELIEFYETFYEYPLTEAEAEKILSRALP